MPISRPRLPRAARPLALLAAAAVASTIAPIAAAQPQADLARYYGFDPMRLIVVDDSFGPTVIGDFNNDGRPDIAVANNRKSRIELYFLRAAVRTEAEQQRQAKANEFPPSPWYDRHDVSVAHRVTALRAWDIDRDGKLDLAYAGASPAELVILRQESPSSFDVLSRRTVRGLAARQSGLAIADVIGDGEPEIIAIAENRLSVFPLSATGTIGEPARVGTPADLAAFFIEDYNGDGMLDIVGVVPDDATPLRLWLQSQDPRRTDKSGLLAAEMRFEMPAVREVQPIRFKDRKAASISVIERASRRIVCYDLIPKPIESKVDTVVGGGGSGTAVTGEHQVRAAVWAFTDGASKDRSVAVADLDRDGQPDLLATDAAANTVAWYRQSDRIGLGSADSFSAFKKPKTIAIGEWNGEPGPEVFVLSEEEKAVGVSEFNEKTGRLSFPTPLPIKTIGAAPVAMGYIDLGGAEGERSGMLAVIVKDRRDHTLELHGPGSAEQGVDGVTAIELKNVNRSPQSMLAADADQDGVPDLLLFTPNEPMVMVRSIGTKSEGEAPIYEVLTDQQMRQYGLVGAAGPSNTALVDMDGDGKNEILIADQNFVRACRYDAERGWRVVEQITLPEAGTQLVGISTIKSGDQTLIIASDKGNGRLLIIAREPAADGATAGAWQVRTRLRLLGFPLGPIFAGAFGGDGEPSVLCIGDDGFALVRLAGERHELDPFAFYRSEAEDRSEHEIELGDVNGDGYLDMVVIDSTDRMCQLLSFTSKRNLMAATEFEVFQTRLFSRGAAREGEPRSALVSDVTGDGKDDIILTVHDRLIIYPQATKAE